MKKQHMILGGLVALAGAWGSTASASVLFSDDFSAVGSGTGFSDNWSAGTISGGQISCTSEQAFRTLTTPIDCTTADFWINTQIQITGGSSNWAGVSLYDGTQEDMFFGSDSASTTWEFDTDGTPDTNTTIPNYTGVMTQVVIHVTTTSIDMWIDPTDTSSIAALGVADASFVGSPLIYPSWSRVRIACGAVNNVVEEIIAATTFDEALGGGPGTAFCFGDLGSGTPCPCANDNDGSVPESGCANGVFASGAKLIGTGTASLSADTLVLATSGLEPSNSGLYFQANNDLSPGNTWGDGLQCAGGQLKRLGVRFADATGYSDTSAWATPISVKAGNIVAGDTKYYQCWYRNPLNPPCGAGVNDFNASNGYAITWTL